MTSDASDELASIEAELGRLRRSALELREQVGSEGPMDSGDVATLITAAEEQEALADTMERRRDELRAELGLDAAG
jgi:hypothetical protein